MNLALTRLDAEISRLGLTPFREVIVSAARSAIRLHPDSLHSTRESCLGGVAALPVGMAWPSWQGKAQSLIAQIALKEVAHLDFDGLLPASGRLLFFYDSEQRAWGFDPKDRGAWTVIHVEDGANVARQPVPAEAVYKRVPLSAAAELSLPPWESIWSEQTGISPDWLDPYVALLEVFNTEEDTIHKMLGHPDPIQGDMQTECQLASNGLYCGDGTGHEDPRAETLRPGATEWQLLLQVDSDDAAGMMWADVGRLYYWIKAADLRLRKFDECWLVSQCS